MSVVQQLKHRTQFDQIKYTVILTTFSEIYYDLFFVDNQITKAAIKPQN